MTPTVKLDRLRVVTFESRMASNLSELLKRNGADVISAPSMQEIPLEKNRDVFSFGEKLFRGEIDVMIFLTGVGTRYLIDALKTKYPENEILERFRQLVIVARGPKPVRVLNELKIPITVTVPEPNTWKDLLEALDQDQEKFFKNKAIAIQEYGRPNIPLAEAAHERAARVIRIPVYRWALPEDTKPLERAIHAVLEGKTDIALFTSAAQMDHVLRMASEMGVLPQIKSAFKKMVIASIGPVCSEAIVSHGVQVDLEPEHPKMGHLVLEVAEKAAQILETKRQKTVAVKPLTTVGVRLASPLQLQDSIFLKACRREKTPYTPIWLMRQAGRYMKEYRAIREKVPFLELCKNSDLAAEVTVTAQEKINADAAIIFSDILLLVEPFGLGLQYSKDDGPVIEEVVRTSEQIKKLPEIDPEESFPFLFEAIRKTRKSLKPNIPLIGFSAAPFTLVSYMIEGGTSKSFRHTKSLMYSEPNAWSLLMDKVARQIGAYLNAQIDAGVQAVQLFDSWVGCLSAEDYEKFVLPYSKKVIDNLRGTGPSKDLSLGSVPVIHFGTNTGHFLEKMSEAGSGVIGVDFRVRLDEAWKRIGYGKAIQGNLDPSILFADQKTIKKHAQDILDQAAGRPGHIFNLGHGVLPETPVDNVIALIEMVHELGGKK